MAGKRTTRRIKKMAAIMGHTPGSIIKHVVKSTRQQPRGSKSRYMLAADLKSRRAGKGPIKVR